VRRKRLLEARREVEMLEAEERRVSTFEKKRDRERETERKTER